MSSSSSEKDISENKMENLVNPNEYFGTVLTRVDVQGVPSLVTHEFYCSRSVENS
jgi:hypothetical protein